MCEKVPFRKSGHILFRQGQLANIFNSDILKDCVIFYHIIVMALFDNLTDALFIVLCVSHS